MTEYANNLLSGYEKHTIVSIDKIDKIREFIEDIVKNKKLKVLLVCDIDDTLIRPKPNVNIGTDPWFNISIRNEDVDVVRKKLSMIYAILNFYGVEEDTDKFVDSLYMMQKDIENNLKYICLTSRHVPFHSYTIMHLKDAGYEKVFVKQNALDIDDHLYMYAEDDTTTPSIRYLDNICCVSGTDKGYILAEMIKKHHNFNKASNSLFDIIVFIDDSINNVTKVNRTMKTFVYHEYLSTLTSVCIHYTHMEKHKNDYNFWGTLLAKML
jgi:hypothetical protein